MSDASAPDGLELALVAPERFVELVAARAAELVAEREAVLVVVGLPTSMSGKAASASADMARDWAAVLEPLVAPVEVRLVDERLTTVTAAAALRASGRSAKKGRSVVDQAAAVALLQGVLDTR